MEKLYTQDDYFNMACEANAQGKLLIKVQEEVEYNIEVLEWEKKTIRVPIIDPETGEPTGETQEIEVDDYTKPIMIDEIDPITGETIKVQKHHTETRTKWVERLEIVDNPDNFARKFFNTSLGYVSRVVHNLTGQKEDFLNDTLNYLTVGYPIITYNADGTQNRQVAVTAEFIEECKRQKEKDFYGDVINENN